MAFLRGLTAADFQKAFTHPEWGVVTLDNGIRMYAWHCRHHTAHIKLGIDAARGRSR